MTGTVVRVARHRALGRLRDCVGRPGASDEMSDRRCPAPIGFIDVVDYWSGDLSPAEEGLIEEHTFTCAGLRARARGGGRGGGRYRGGGA